MRRKRGQGGEGGRRSAEKGKEQGRGGKRRGGRGR